MSGSGAHLASSGCRYPPWTLQVWTFVFDWLSAICVIAATDSASFASLFLRAPEFWKNTMDLNNHTLGFKSCHLDGWLVVLLIFFPKLSWLEPFLTPFWCRVSSPRRQREGGLFVDARTHTYHTVLFSKDGGIFLGMKVLHGFRITGFSILEWKKIEYLKNGGSNEPRKKTRPYFPLYWLFNRDPYFIVLL